MTESMVDITLHIDEETSHEDREKLRDKLLGMDGVMAAASHDEKPHLMIIEYDPDVINSSAFIKIAQDSGLHAELIGL
jgi:hypothetical protein